jgi:hypothetical protein
MRREDVATLHTQYGDKGVAVAGWWDTLTDDERAEVSYAALEILLAELEDLGALDNTNSELQTFSPWWRMTAYMLGIPQSDRLCNWLRHWVNE